jgi:CheY-like chemotaxis protein
MEKSVPFSRYTARYPGTNPPKYTLAKEERHAPSCEEKHVLIVDDDPFFRSLLKVMLGQVGCPIAGIIREAEDSSTALRICSNHPVDLVFCDLNLPNFRSENGLAIVRALRKDLPDVSIFMVTAENSEELIREVRSAGATGHLLKPINLRTLKKIFP